MVVLLYTTIYFSVAMFRILFIFDICQFSICLKIHLFAFIVFGFLDFSIWLLSLVGKFSPVISSNISMIWLLLHIILSLSSIKMCCCLLVFMGGGMLFYSYVWIYWLDFWHLQFLKLAYCIFSSTTVFLSPVICLDFYCNFSVLVEILFSLSYSCQQILLWILFWSNL